jgi:hypothetical protein
MPERSIVRFSPALFFHRFGNLDTVFLEMEHNDNFTSPRENAELPAEYFLDTSCMP